LGEEDRQLRIDLDTGRSNPYCPEAPPIRVLLRLFGVIFIGGSRESFSSCVARCDLNLLITFAVIAEEKSATAGGVTAIAEPACC
jgi:hypothetical protein